MAEQRPAREDERRGRHRRRRRRRAARRSSGTATPGFPAATAPGCGVARLRRPPRSTATHRRATPATAAGDRSRRSRRRPRRRGRRPSTSRGRASRSATGWGTAHQPALRHRAAAASSSSAAAPGVEVPGAEARRAPWRRASPPSPPPVAGLGELVAARGLERPPGGAAVLDGLGAQVDVHDAASRDRASRIRCISMLPDATVADTEYRWWSSTARRKRPASPSVAR